MDPIRRTPTVQVYRDVSGGWRWRLRASNGRIVAQGEAHTRRRDAVRAANSMMHAALWAAWAESPTVR